MRGALVAGWAYGARGTGQGSCHTGYRSGVSLDGDFLIGFHRDEPSKVSLELTYPDGKVQKKELQIEKRDYDIQRIDGLPPRKVTPEQARHEAYPRREQADQAGA